MDIPYDIWLRIVELLPRDFVRTLFTVNRALFEIAMDERYREVAITKLDQRTLWILFRLRDPSITARVRCILVNPLLVNPYIQNGQNLWRVKSQRGWPSRVKKAVNTVFRTNLSHQWHTKKMMVGIDRASSKGIYLSFDDVIGAMIDAFLALSHVYEFAVEDYVPDPDYNLQPFYDAAWAGFGSNLRKLSFTMGMGTFTDALYPPSLHFPQLREVSITFLSHTGLGTASDTIHNIVAPFINRHNSTIRALSFASRYLMNYPIPFTSFCLLPVLQSVAMEFPFYDSVWLCDSGFVRFLRNHAKTVHHIELRVNGFGHPQINLSPSFRTWITRYASDEAIFGGLESLTIPTVHVADFDSVMLAIRASIGSLTKLALDGRYLSTEEVEVMIAMFPQNTAHGSLRSLRLHVSDPTPSLPRLVHDHFPRLQELRLLDCPSFI